MRGGRGGKLNKALKGLKAQNSVPSKAPETDEDAEERERDKIEAERRKAEKNLKGLPPVSKLLEAFSYIPRVARIVFQFHPFFLTFMTFYSCISGFFPAFNAWITKMVLDTVNSTINKKNFTPPISPPSGLRGIFGFSDQITTVLFLIGLKLGINLFTSLMSFLYNSFHRWFETDLESEVHEMVLRKAASLDISYFEQHKTQRQIQECNGCGFRFSNLLSSVREAAIHTITLSTMLFLLSSLSWKTAFWSLIPALLSFYAELMWGWRTYYEEVYHSREKRMREYIGNLIVSPSHQKEIQLFGFGGFLIQKWKQLSSSWSNQKTSATLKMSIARNLIKYLEMMIDSVVYFHLVLDAIEGRLTLGELGLCVEAIKKVSRSLSEFLLVIAKIHKDNLYIADFFDLMGAPRRILESPNPVPFRPGPNGLEIEFRNVSFHYPFKTRMVLKDVSFKINEGETMALVGMNGSGKTTMVKLLARFYDPTDGEILIQGVNLKDYKLDELRRNISVIFQDFVKLDLPAGDNIMIGDVEGTLQEVHKQEKDALTFFGPFSDEMVSAMIRRKERGEARGDQVLAKSGEWEDPNQGSATTEGSTPDVHDRLIWASLLSGADDVILKLPNKFNQFLGTLMGDDSCELSGGEWQKMALARLFYRTSAGLLVLDEPTSALDPKAEYEVFKIFRDLVRGKSAIFISHRFGTVRLADKILVLEKGMVLEIGSHEELMQNKGRYAELFNLQAEAFK